ncbi:MAG: DUF1836 domain-containing protein [Blautia sp.]|nr:DUF1836 domain-containing protein [Blautia sp.]
MTKEKKEMFRQIMNVLKGIEYIEPSDLPNINLYMDQVTTFMEDQLSATRRHEDDKILTKTMINNYAKNKLLPPPDKKRYSKEHLLMLIFIYYFKNFLSMSDIQTLTEPITEKYFQSGSGHDMTYIYEEVFRTIKSQSSFLMKDLLKRYNMADETFKDAPEEDQTFLRAFSFICLLSFDIYMKKIMVERLIDAIDESKDK